MSIFQFIYWLGIINIIFVFSWKWAVAIPTSLLFALLRINKGVYFVKALGSYLLVSLTAIITLFALQNNDNILALIFFPFVGGFILFMGYASNSYEAQQQAAMEHNYELIESLKYDDLFMIGALVLYIVSLFLPIISINPITLSFYKIIGWAQNLPYIGWLIGIGGILFLISVIWYGITASGMLIGSIVRRFKRSQ